MTKHESWKNFGALQKANLSCRPKYLIRKLETFYFVQCLQCRFDLDFVPTYAVYTLILHAYAYHNSSEGQPNALQYLAWSTLILWWTACLMREMGWKENDHHDEMLRSRFVCLTSNWSFRELRGLWKVQSSSCGVREGPGFPSSTMHSPGTFNSTFCEYFGFRAGQGLVCYSRSIYKNPWDGHEVRDKLGVSLTLMWTQVSTDYPLASIGQSCRQIGPGAIFA